MFEIGGGATNEAIRLLKLSKWQAAEKEGKKVRVGKTFEGNMIKVKFEEERPRGGKGKRR